MDKALFEIEIKENQSTDRRRVVLTSKEHEDLDFELSLKRHSIEGALDTFANAIEALKSGYRFDDQKSGDKIDSMNEALATLRGEFGTIKKIYQPKDES